MSFEIGRRRVGGVLQRPAVAEQPLAHIDRDPVEHDRRDHLVRADGRLQEPGDPGPRRAREGCRPDAQQDVQEGIQSGEVDAEPVGDVEADEVLALPADVEHPAAEGEGDREPAEDERRRLQEGLRQVVRRRGHQAGRRMEDPVEARPVEDVPVGDERVVTRGEDDDPAHQEGDHDRHGRNDDPPRALPEREAGGERSGRRGRLRRFRRLAPGRGHAAVRSLPPSISSPISSSETSPVCSPTSSPS